MWNMTVHSVYQMSIIFVIHWHRISEQFVTSTLNFAPWRSEGTYFKMSTFSGTAEIQMLAKFGMKCFSTFLLFFANQLRIHSDVCFFAIFRCGCSKGSPGGRSSLLPGRHRGWTEGAQTNHVFHDPRRVLHRSLSTHGGTGRPLQKVRHKTLYFCRLE